MKLLLFISVVLVFIGCNRSEFSEKKTVVGFTNYERVEKKIVLLEDTLQYAYRLLMNNEVDTLPFKSIHMLENEYKHAFVLGSNKRSTALYLDKLQQLYLQEKKYALSLNWTDTLLHYFPNYDQKATLLLSAATTAELYLKDQKKTEYYYYRLLNEHPKLKPEVVEMVKFRLKNFNKS